MVYSLLAVLSALHQTAFLLNGGIHHELEVWIFPPAPFSADSPMVGAVRASPENFSSWLQLLCWRYWGIILCVKDKKWFFPRIVFFLFPQIYSVPFTVNSPFLAWIFSFHKAWRYNPWSLNCGLIKYLSVCSWCNEGGQILVFGMFTIKMDKDNTQNFLSWLCRFKRCSPVCGWKWKEHCVWVQNTPNLLQLLPPSGGCLYWKI